MLDVQEPFGGGGGLLLVTALSTMGCGEIRHSPGYFRLPEYHICQFGRLFYIYIYIYIYIYKHHYLY